MTPSGHKPSLCEAKTFICSKKLVSSFEFLFKTYVFHLSLLSIKRNPTKTRNTLIFASFKEGFKVYIDVKYFYCCVVIWEMYGYMIKKMFHCPTCKKNIWSIFLRILLCYIYICTKYNSFCRVKWAFVKMLHEPWHGQHFLPTIKFALNY